MNTTKGSICIGLGAQYLRVEDHEVLIAAPPDEKGDIASLRLRPDGTILMNEKVVGQDTSIVEAFREMIYQMIHQDVVVLSCSACGVETTRPKPKPEVWTCPLCRRR